MRFQDVGSFELLREYLKHFSSWEDDPAYDVMGVFVLLGALLENLRVNSDESDFEMLSGYLSQEQKAVLVQLASAAQCSSEDERSL